MLRRFLLATLGAATLAGGLVLSLPAAAPAHALSAPVSYAEGSCVGTMCAPPNGALPGLNPPRLPFAEPAAACDGTEPEFSYPEGNPQMSRADVNNPALRRMYSWYRDPKTDAPVKWGAHCDVLWSVAVGAPKPTIVMSEVITRNATVPARIMLDNRPVAVGESLTLPSVTVPRKAPDASYTVLPVAKLTDIRWVGTANCAVTPLPSANTLASVKVAQPIDPRTTACVAVETTWDLAATARSATGAVTTITDVVGSQGQHCGDACTVTNRTATNGESEIIAEEGLQPDTASGDRAAALASATAAARHSAKGCKNEGCAPDAISIADHLAARSNGEAATVGVSYGFLQTASREGILAAIAIGLGLGLLVGWFRLHRT